MLNTFQAPGDIYDMKSLAMLPIKGSTKRKRMISSQGMHDFNKIRHFDSKNRDTEYNMDKI